MCGIIGYCGHRLASEVLLGGLRHLEYRGYDSAGIGVGNGGNVAVFKQKGKIGGLRDSVPGNLAGHWGIGHSRWATHGEVNDINAHPHVDCSGRIAVCHNGIIENHRSLKNRLRSEGHVFRSETDSEVIVHLVESFYQDDLEAAVKAALSLLKGTYGVLVMHADHPEQIIGARNGSPMILGLGEGENLIASDVNGMIAHTKQVVYLNDGEMVSMVPQEYGITDMRNRVVNRTVEYIGWELQELEKGDFPHYMLKEIHEQTESIPRAMKGRIDKKQATALLSGMNMSQQELLAVKRITIIAAGTSYYAGRVAAYVIESLARIPCGTELASELRYRNPIIEKGTLYLAISQSGETLDTLMAVRELRSKGSRVLGICNVVGSTIARESDGGVYIHSGPEIAVASTKAFTSQLTALYLFTLLMGRMRSLSWAEGKNLIRELEALPERIGIILNQSEHLHRLAKKYHGAGNFLFLGRGPNYPVALEGALKLKEIAYIHAEGYSAAEIKHGPIALINEHTPSLFLVPEDGLKGKILSNMKEIKARGGPVIAICAEGDIETAETADDVITVPRTTEFFYPFVMAVPLQLFAYYCAVELGRDVDQPRNLAKSVTVE